MIAKVLFGGVAVVLGLQMPLVLKPGTQLDWFYVLPLAAVCLFLGALGVAATRTRATPAAVGLACLVAASFAILVSPSFLNPGAEFLSAVLGAIALPVLSAIVATDLSRLRGRRGWLVFGSGVAGALILLYAGTWRYAMQFVSESGGIGQAIWWAYWVTGVLTVATCLALVASIRGSRS